MSQNEVKIGEKAPGFCLPNEEGKEICLKDLSGRWVVLYFYPKDNTPGCTTEAIDFTRRIKDFESINTVIYGISKDTVESHKRFCNKKNLEVSLLSDVDNKVIEAYGIWKPKKLFGKEVLGIVRSTFIISPDGLLKYVWSPVKVKGHADDVYDTITKLQSE